MSAPSMIAKIAARVLPSDVVTSLQNYRILSKGFGQYASIKNWECIDAEGTPIPWYTYPAIEYLKQLDFSAKAVFEYGSGNSTRFWSGISRTVTAVEDDQEWYEKIRPKLGANVHYRFITDPVEYAQSIRAHEGLLDVIIVDGSHRYECAIEALPKLRDDGFIILDNSDWQDKTSRLLREADLIEVDMSGFGPINGYTWTTSFYFRRNVKLTPRQDCQPARGIGSIHHRMS
ncbi:MAG: hypothetical protein QM755_02940 [Luteolibacter sp.]